MKYEIENSLHCIIHSSLKITLLMEQCQSPAVHNIYNYLVNDYTLENILPAYVC